MSRKKSQKRSAEESPQVWYTLTDLSAEEILSSGYVSFKNNTSIRAVVNKIADVVSSMPIHLMQNSSNGDIRLSNAMSKKIDINPNNHMTRKNFIYKIITTTLLDGGGNCVIYPKLTQDGLIDDLIFWDMDKVTYQCTTENYKVVYNNVAFEPDEVIHIVFNPKGKNPFIGQGITKELTEIAKSLTQANATKTTYQKSKWRPGLVIMAQGLPDSLSNSEGRAAIAKQYLEVAEDGQPWILPAVSFDVREIKPLTLKDLALSETLEIDKREVAGVLGVPPFMLGIGNYSVDEYNTFISTVVKSWADIITQEFTRKLLYDPTWYFRANPRSLYQYEPVKAATVGKMLVGLGAISRNELRNMFGYAPMEGLDEILMLENFIPAAKLADQKKLIGGDEN